jgi:hypothetical protein
MSHSFVTKQKLKRKPSRIKDVMGMIANHDPILPTVFIRFIGIASPLSKSTLTRAEVTKKNVLGIIPSSERHSVWSFLNKLIGHKTRKYRELYGRHDTIEFFDTQALFSRLIAHMKTGTYVHANGNIPYVIVMTPTFINILKANLRKGSENALNHIDPHTQVMWIEKDDSGDYHLYQMTVDTEKDITDGFNSYFNNDK